MGRAHVLRDMWKDIKVISKYLWTHRRLLWSQIGFVFACFTAVTSSVFSILLVGDNHRTTPYCAPGGDLDYTTDTYDPWDTKHLFQITLGFGTFSFAGAKAIDVAWDIVVGRGGQLLLSAITFLVFSKALNRLLEEQGSSISYNSFRAIVFEPPSLMGTARFCKDITSRLNWRARWSIIWFAFASIYVVAFPTITSAMTGYNANVQAYFNTGSSKDLLLTKGYFRRAIYHIKDADRIPSLNLTKSYIVGTKGFGTTIERPEYDYYQCLQYRATLSGDCALALAIADYITAYPLNTSYSGSSYLNMSIGGNLSSLTIASPTLDIEVFSTIPVGIPHALYYVSALPTGQDRAASELPFIYTTEDGVKAYSAADLNQKGSCDSQTNYMWGFSFLLLNVFFILTGIWALGMYTMWSDAFWNSRLDREGRDMGFYRGVADMSNAMWKDMLWEASELTPESKIKEMLTAQKNGGRIKFEGFEHDKLPVSRLRTFRLWRNEVSSLHGWTGPWKALHWLWFIVLSGIAVLILILGIGGLMFTGWATCVLFGGVLAIVALAMIIAGIRGAVSRWIRWLGWSKSQLKEGHNMICLIEDSPEVTQADVVERLK